MARRSGKKKDTELLQGLASLAILGSFFWGFKATGSIVGGAVIAGCAIGVIIAVAVIYRLQKEERLKRSGIQDIDKMDGFQFEHYLKLLFTSYGYNVKMTKASGDYGADLILSNNGKTIAVQAKRYKNNVGISAIQEVVASKGYYNAHEAWVVTNSDFTEAAINLARSNGVRLINREQLIEMILRMKSKKASKPQQNHTKTKTEKKTCESCMGEMVIRKTTKGYLYVCMSYPKCRNVKAIE